jgi:acetyl/propionyl-CoA carboxylase alpha subunit/acetyl-CoA carboxylase carboxyltransferase component
VTAADRTRPIERIAIVNRGEAAMRLIHAVRELNEEGGVRFRTIALYTDPDRRALFVREADEAVSLGPALIPGPRGTRSSPYSDLERLEIGLREARADAAWVGWGFVAERPDFADLCTRLGVVLVGPSAQAMRLVGDKIAAKRLAEECGVGVGAWSEGPVDTLEAAHTHAARIGYPLMVKAAAGGGGRGIRAVRAAGELAEAFDMARAEAMTAFGDRTLFMESMLPRGRHVEVQVVGDGAGTVWTLGVRDCSVQRRHQKVLEESSSTALDALTQAQLSTWAARLCERAGYRGAATVEFLLDPVSGQTFFMEINARLQVEHPVTEATTGVDIVKLQLHLATGGALRGKAPQPRGHAVEVRVCAEDPDNGFAPSPGVVDVLRLPTGPGIRVDTGVAEGDAVAPEFDSMIAKVIAWGRDRPEALARLRRALGEMVIVLRGGTTNLAFLLELLAAPEVVDGTADIEWLDRAGSFGADRPFADVALLVAATEVDQAELAVERAQFYSSAVRARPRVSDKIGHNIELVQGNQAYRLHLDRRGPGSWLVELDGRRADVRVERVGRYERRIWCAGRTHRVLCAEHGTGFKVDVDGVPHTVARDGGGVVRAPSPAVVVSVRVRPGDVVVTGDVLAVLEAMKLEMPLCAPFGGIVSRVLVTQNVQVDMGSPLFQLTGGEEQRAPGAQVSGGRIVMPQPVTPDDSGRAACRRALDVIRQLMLGYDVDAAASTAALADHARGCASGIADTSLWAAEDDVLQVFADVCSLSRRRPDDDVVEGAARSLQDHLFYHLRSLDAQPTPPAFAEALRRALAHYGVTALERSPELEDALYLIVRSHRRSEIQVPAVLSLLDRRLERSSVGVGGGDDLRRLLDRLQTATRHTHPAVADLAREVRHRCFDQPLLDRARQTVYDEAEDLLAALALRPDTAGRAERITALVECPQPLHNLLSARFADASPALRGVMLEVMTRRYYRDRGIVDVRVVDCGGRLAAIADLPERGRTSHVVTTFALDAELVGALETLRPLIDDLPQGDGVVVDAYVWSDGPTPPVDALARQVRRSVVAAHLPRAVRRVVVAVTGPGRGLGMSASQHLAYRRAGDSFREEPLYRSLHPMMGERLQLWRLRNFRVRRLPSVEDVYVFHGMSRDNPKDERLFAIAEVRDLTPVRDAAGRLVALPHLERMLLEALASIRTWQSHRNPDQRLQWNRVLLYIWPQLALSAREIYDIVRRITPETDGLGLEKLVVRARVPNASGGVSDTVLEFSDPLGAGVSVLRFDTPTTLPIQPLSAYRQKVVSMLRRGLVYPYEIVRMLASSADATTGDVPPGEFIEHDLGEDGDLRPVDRPYGENTANLVVGVIRSFTWKYPEGMERVILLGDPSRSLGALAQPECRRIIAAIDLAERMQVPLEWFTISSGAKISMDSGTENMDWIARVLRRIVEFTQAGGEINLVVNGINVGAQPYWNAEATMLMHTKGVLIMTPEGAMVLTGKQALDYSGGVSAEDNLGIGGYERVMGPNGQAQYWAPTLGAACQLLLRHYEHTFRAPGERFPRRAATSDPFDRDVGTSPHPRGTGSEFTSVGDIFSEVRNPGRKKPFDIRAVMGAVVDQDHAPLERWPGMQHADIAVVWDAHLGGYPVCVIGLESRPLQRVGFIPADGPDRWTPGTLFPQSSRKVARAINAASGNRPVVVLANLSGFDGSPESMRRLQLEFGAEIGRAVVNFRGPMVFCVISRYHGGAFVVFSAALSETLEVVAVEGSFASVIGGAPAAAVVFARDVEKRTRADSRVVELARRVESAEAGVKAPLRAQMAALLDEVRGEKLGEVAAEFDAVHTVQRAQQMGSVHHIISASTIRPYLIDAVERGVNREVAAGGVRP